MQWLNDLREDEEFRKISEQERLKLEVTEAIARLLEESGVSRAELARRLGTSGAYVTKLLRGDNNFTVQTMSDIFFVLGRSAHVRLAPLGDSVCVPSTRETTVSQPLSGHWRSSSLKWAPALPPDSASIDGGAGVAA